MPDDKGVESLARQVRVSGRAYPLFQIAQLILQKAGTVRSPALTLKKKADGWPWPRRSSSAPWTTPPGFPKTKPWRMFFKNHFGTFYLGRNAPPPSRPRGVYTFVAQCGMSGVILGPPNDHDYQNQLRKLHTERFARMPFDAFKARVKIVKDEAVVKKWVEDQSFRTEFICLNVPEPAEAGPPSKTVEKHFRATHKDNIIKSVETYTVGRSPSSRQHEIAGLATV